MGDGAQHLLSIVTVVKDDPEGFVSTVASIARQDCGGVELVVVDSSNQSVEMGLQGISDSMSVAYEWQPPQGVYPAMNVGLERATGDYVLFLNAGDRFHSDTVLAEVLPVLRERRPRWLYGQVCFIAEDGRRVTPEPFDYRREKRSHFSRGRFPPHQGTVAGAAAMRDLGGFDTSYRIAADYALMLRLSQVADPVEVDTVIADFSIGGLSTTSWRQSVDEFHRARRQVFDLRGSDYVREAASTQIQVLRMSLSRTLGRG